MMFTLVMYRLVESQISHANIAYLLTKSHGISR